eukprot:TRINITY_DN7564_c0_g1_i1.p2 TRINITY_DN7564_c0_g1~~TRINITY_DN7564_c0_g1_i1.p2  ORF type:complete len:124 (+),score=28.87 TRINITY_DN7564_c0_g1_i1:1289-1660(+)
MQRESGKRTIYLLKSELFRREYKDVLAIPHAHVPLLKLTQPKTGLACDISFSPFSLGEEKAEFINACLAIDPRVRPLILAFKRWANRRGLNSAVDGTLNSLSLSLMVLIFFADKKPADPAVAA